MKFSIWLYIILIIIIDKLKIKVKFMYSFLKLFTYTKFTTLFYNPLIFRVNNEKIKSYFKK